ncbi:type II toxin-antitoxin system VapC family toxin [Oscillatoria sp. FACHB-1406]|uniref:type II toxin-antitoxin system VapC family toxin n=1 Tax=Oscillatoria sp. FACHB-1406 TaxID=2692846 RepID=UPI0016825825|nr:type II toxin-antitoxin system VapC family toxin [Oscillatoria sp. FACHB-1406]MBD2579312.1 type II toxin-antitoxin system VapC family toxin [Oscillatoria sp. FACHB-1406]
MPSLLLDTHTFIWLSENDSNLPVSTRDRIEETEDVFVSIASFWEISIKLTIGKLSLQADFDEIEARFAETRFQLLPILMRDTVQLRRLPLHHRDPFDRILVAQAINHSLALVSADAAFDAYPIQRVWI